MPLSAADREQADLAGAGLDVAAVLGEDARCVGLSWNFAVVGSLPRPS